MMEIGALVIASVMIVVLLIICVAMIFAMHRSIAAQRLSLPQTISEVAQRIFDNLSFASNSYNQQMESLQNSLNHQIQAAVLSQRNQLELLYQQLIKISNLNETKIENMRRSMEQSLARMQADNSQKLEQMRSTVEEKLQSTLEQRLGASFKIVSDRLEMVHKGLGEMQHLASGVGDLKKVLTNVKTRGVWGEVQLDAIMKQILTPEQYEINAAVRHNSQDRVEYAIKLPGKRDDTPVLLPIDAKFPMEGYQRLISAQEVGDVPEIEKQAKLLESEIKKSAKLIANKYLNPPITTDFAIMFLPIEGLYAEVLRNPGLIEVLQREYRVVITSPTTLSAILNSLQMGFKTIAIEKSSSEVWRLLESIKPEFSKFADLLGKTRLKLDQASQAISDAEHRTQIIQKKLNRASVDTSSPQLDLHTEIEQIVE